MACPGYSHANVLFESAHILEPLGVEAEEAVVATTEEGEVWLAVQNFQGITADS